MRIFSARARELLIGRAAWSSDVFPAGFRGEAATGLRQAAINLSDSSPVMGLAATVVR